MEPTRTDTGCTWVRAQVRSAPQLTFALRPATIESSLQIADLRRHLTPVRVVVGRMLAAQPGCLQGSDRSRHVTAERALSAASGANCSAHRRRAPTRRTRPRSRPRARSRKDPPELGDALFPKHHDMPFELRCSRAPAFPRPADSTDFESAATAFCSPAPSSAAEPQPTAAPHGNPITLGGGCGPIARSAQFLWPSTIRRETT